MKNGRNTLLLITLLLGISCFSLAGEARAAAEDIRVTVSPSVPRPGERVAVSLESYLTDLNRADIVWTVNGKIVKQGKGEKSIETETASLGKTTTVRASVRTTDMGTIEKTVSIRPAGLTLLWQANSYTPPFYRGKALAPSESTITAVAVPDMISSAGRRLGNNEIIFTWRRNGSVIGAQSGTGKNTFSFKSGRLPDDEPLIEVEASAPQENLKAYERMRVPITAPLVLFYEDHPLRGVLLGEAIASSFVLSKSEITIVAYPYFVEGRKISDSDLAYGWRINNEAAAATGQANELTLRTPGGSGTALISFSLQNLQKLFESAARTLQINFGAEERLLSPNTR